MATQLATAVLLHTVSILFLVLIVLLAALLVVVSR
jgi:hypothetical protein